jgi:hypothetical protein
MGQRTSGKVSERERPTHFDIWSAATNIRLLLALPGLGLFFDTADQSENVSTSLN